MPPSLREVASGVPRKPDDGRSTPSVIAASGADSSLWEGAVISLPPRGRGKPLPYDRWGCSRNPVCLYRIAAFRAADMFSRSNMVYRLCKDMVDTYLVK